VVEAAGSVRFGGQLATRRNVIWLVVGDLQRNVLAAPFVARSPDRGRGTRAQPLAQLIAARDSIAHRATLRDSA
jgi:hypothetical protein